MKFKFFFLVVAVLMSSAVMAQYRVQPQDTQEQKVKKDDPKALDRLYFGGGGGFSGGSNYLNVNVAPLAGYRLTDQFAMGVRLTYQYVKLYDVNYNNFGGGPFAQFNFTENFFGYTEYEYLTLTSPYLETPVGYNSWFVGIGYLERLNDHAAFSVMALYNVLYGSGTNSPYSSPLSIRINFLGGF